MTEYNVLSKIKSYSREIVFTLLKELTEKPKKVQDILSVNPYERWVHIK